MNGTRAPGDAIADIELDSLVFWALIDDVRDGAFACAAGADRSGPRSGCPERATHGRWTAEDRRCLHHASRSSGHFRFANFTINDPDTEVVAGSYFGSMIVLDDPRHRRLRSIVSLREGIAHISSQCVTGPIGWSHR